VGKTSGVPKDLGSSSGGVIRVSSRRRNPRCGVNGHDLRKARHPIARSSRATPVTVAYRSPIVAMTRDPAGSSVSSAAGLPVSIWQKSQRLVHWSPPMRNVASRSSQHS
jgi:hypothetical protein